MMRGIFTAALVVLFLGSCSVKEDRYSCPCRLSLDFSGVDTDVVGPVFLLATLDGEVVFSDSVGAAAVKEDYVREVPHGNLRVNAWCAPRERIDEENGVVIPFGCECPPIYMHSFMADTRGEVCHEKVTMSKNHCRLTVRVEGCEEMPYSLTFRGNVDGYDLDGLPSDGDFACVAYPGEAGSSEAVLPRQLDSSLMLEVDDGTSVAKTFAVGEYILASGYDWSSENLEDVTIVLDYYLTYITISVQEWDKEYIYDITL